MGLRNLGYVVAKPALGRSAASTGERSSAIVWWAVVPLALALAGLSLRTYRLELMGWVPDTYVRLEMTRRLIDGNFPLSPITPPGVSFFLAPFFAVLPQDQWTLQGVTIGCSILLLLMGYLVLLRQTGDRLAAGLLAVVLAISPAQVYAARDALFDVIVSFLLALAVFAVPWLRRRGIWAYVAYGLLLAVLFNIRPTHVAMVPAVALYYLSSRDALTFDRRLVRSLLSFEVLATGATIIAVTGVSLAIGGWFGRVAGAPVDLGVVPANLLYYFVNIAGNPGALVLTAPLAVVGMRALWRIERGLALAIGALLLCWPLSYAPFPFQMARYMLPVSLFFYLLVAIGASQIVRGLVKTPARRRFAPTLYLGVTALLVGLTMLARTGGYIAEWPRYAAESDEGAARVVASSLANTDNDALVITAVASALEGKTTGVAYYDLIDHWIDHGTDDASLDILNARAAGARAEGREVYYLYSHWEAGEDFHSGADEYWRFYNSIAPRYKMVEVMRVPTLNRNKFPWVLYRLEPL